MILYDFPFFNGQCLYMLAKNKLNEEEVNDTFPRSLKMIGENMQVKDAMSRGVVTVPMDATAAEVAETMANRDVSAVVAVDENGETFGFVSEMDILSRLGEKNWEIASIEDLMASSVETVNPGMKLKDAAKQMAEKHIHRLIVMSEDQVGASYRPIGILSPVDVIKYLVQK